jgi:uncharacterized protein YfaS (alpha-2-macroglobulin family)
MRALRLFCIAALAGVVLATFCFRAGAVSLPELEPKAQAYAAALKTKHGGRSDDARALLRAVATAAENAQWAEVVRLREQLAGRALAGQRIPGETTAGLLHKLAQAWREHQAAADEGLWAAYLAQNMLPRDRSGANLTALVLVGQILIDQITALHGDFEYRGKTLGSIDERLKKLEYSPARIAAEESKGGLPAEIRELMDLKAREERERVVLIEKITQRMAFANVVYEEMAKSSAANGLGDEIKNLSTQKLFYVKDVYADARRTEAAICIEFNLPLRPDAGEYRDMVKVFPIGTDGKINNTAARTDRTVQDQTICLHGLRHGYGYHVLAQKGLPSRAGVTLAQDFDTRVEREKPKEDDSGPMRSIDPKAGLRIPNRVPSAGFRGAAFILPKFGGGSIPLMTVNVEHVDLELLRLSDRTLYRQIALGHIGNEMAANELGDLRKHFSDNFWRGGVDLAPEPNQTVTTEIPLRQLFDARAAEVAKLEGRELVEPYLSPSISTGSLRGRFRIDKVSLGAPGAAAEEPGLYAFVAKRKHHSLGSDRELDQDDAERADLSGESYRKRQAFYGDNDYSSCKDEVTGRDLSCKLAVQWFVLTDLGLSYYRGPKELYVIARSLVSGKPIRDARVQVLAANNRVLAEGLTDSSGVARFDSRLTRGTEGNRLAAMTAYQGADFSFLQFGRDVFDLSDYGIAGRRAPRLYDAYVYPDRGIFRPEETIHTTLLVRDTEGNAPQHDLPPVIVKLRASNGQIIDEKRIASAASWHLSGAAVDLSVPSSAPLGQADILVYMGGEKEPIGTTTVQLDQFRPDRARITLVREADWQVATTPDGTVTIRGFADAQYLYGLRPEGSLKSDAPAADLAAEVSMLIQAAPTPFPGCYAQFSFGRIENELTPLLHRQALANHTTKDGDLGFDTTAKLPAGDYPLEARFTLTLFDEGGKVGQQSRMLHIPVARAWLGVEHDARLLPTKAGFFALKLNMIALDARNKLRATRLTYRVWRERNVFIWHEESNIWRYQPDVQRTLVKEGTVAAAGRAADGCQSPNATAEIELPLGRYYVEVEDESGPRVTFRKDAGWSGAGVHAPTPDRLTIYSDARKEGDIASYHPGDTATFSIEAPFDGEVLLAIAGDRIHLWDSTASTTNRQATVKIRIDPAWAGISFYALATVYRRNTDGTVANGPSRAIGAVYFAVDREAERQLKLEMANLPDRISAERPLGFDLRSEGLQGKAWATVYAVDEGLISLNGHPEPSPFQHFFGQRALGLEVFDNYGRILLADKGSRDRSGGDRSRRLFLTNYTSDRIVSEFTGPVEFVNGVAHVQFDKPFDFSGTIRIAAVAWTERKVGAATRFVVPRQRIVADLRLPRFMTPGDRATVALAVTPLDARDGRYRVSVRPREPLKVEGLVLADRSEGKLVGSGAIELDLRNKEKRTLDAVLSLPPGSKPAESGVAIDIESAGDGASGPRITHNFDVAVRPAEAPAGDVAFVTLQPDETLDGTRVLQLARARFVEKGLAVQLHASSDPLSVIRTVGPDTRDPQVGMLERLVWRGMLLLHANNSETRNALSALVREIEALQASDGFYVGYRLVTETGLHESRDIVDRVHDPLGQFERYEIWRTALALDFLSQARSSSIRVSEPGLQTGVAALRVKLRKVLQNLEPENEPAQNSSNQDTSNQDSSKSSEQPTDTRLALVEEKDDPAAARSGALRAPAGPAEKARPRSPALISKLLRAGTERQEAKTQDDKPAANEPEEDTSKPESRDVDACDEDLLYATFVLAQHDALDRFDLQTLANRCGKKLSPIGAAMLAAALNKFGVVEEARGVLASIDPRGGATGRDSTTENISFDAMMLAFLALADASPGLKSELAQRIARMNQPLSLATRAWLVRAYAEGSAPSGDTANPLSLRIEGPLPLETRSEHELVSELVPVAELASRNIGLRNTGGEPVTVALVLRGIPVESPGQPAGNLSISRRVINQQGETLDLEHAELKLNDVLYVILTGKRELDASKDPAHLQDPIVLSDRLPASFEIVDRDVFALARTEGVGLRAVLPSDGKQGRLRVAEARDDQLLTVVKSTPQGNFQIGYSVRVVATGRFVHPGAIAEDLYRPEIATRTEDGTVQVAGRAPR